MIRWYMARVSVHTPDEDIIEDFFERAQNAGLHPLAAVAACELALQCHRENQALYASVTRGTW